jgi:hypothetical protein
VGALSAGLALPFFSILAHAGPLDGRPAVVSAQHAPPIETRTNGAGLARWRDYARASITPQFSWAVQPQALLAPDVLDNYSADIVRAPLFEVRASGNARFGISVATGDVADTPGAVTERATRSIGLPNPGLQRTVVAPSLSTPWGDAGSVRLTGVLAYQRFASLGLGTMDDTHQLLPGWLADSSYGAGARVDIGNRLGDRLHWDLGYQSRVGMGAFAHYRGVFADPGDFDIPASATASLSYALTPQFAIDAGVQRVQYSAITPFTSSNLPTRFLALLGDSSSPVFAWRDLNVYSLGWTLSDEGIGDVQMRYTTRQQPVPTSKLLEGALADATADDMFTLGWSRGFGAGSNLSFSASYASSPYYLLMPTYTTRDDARATRFEFEALWSIRF